MNESNCKKKKWWKQTCKEVSTTVVDSYIFLHAFLQWNEILLNCRRWVVKLIQILFVGENRLLSVPWAKVVVMLWKFSSCSRGVYTMLIS